MISREVLILRIRPLVEELAIELATTIYGRLEAQIDQTLAEALDAARSALASDLEAPPIQSNRDRSNMLRREADATVAAREPLTRRPSTCRKCGAVGYTSKGCGTTHKPLRISALSMGPATSSGKLTPAVRTPSPAPSPIPVEEVAPEPAEVDLDDASDDEEEIEVAPAPTPGRRDRFAEIEASRQARKSDARSRAA